MPSSSSLALGATVLCAIACIEPLPPIPPGGQISCTANVDCPSGWICRSQLGRCVPVGADDVAPALVADSGSVTPTHAGRGARLEARFEIDEALVAPPEVRLGATRFAFESNDGGRWIFSYVVAGTEPEGAATVLVTATDPAGNVARELALGTVTLDYTAPALSSAEVAYAAAPSNPLGLVTAATVGTRILITVSASEALDPAVVPVLTLTAGDELLAAPAVRHDGGSAAFELTVPDGAQDGTYVPTVAWRDLAGNATELATFSTPPVRIRTSTPVLAVDQSKVTYLRSPWGNPAPESLGGFTVPSGPYFALAPAEPLSDAATLPPETFALASGEVTRLRLWADGSRSSLLGAATPGPTGAWPRERLADLDAQAIWATGLDAAGNESAPVRIETAEWVATANPQAIGSNPHALATTTYASVVLHDAQLASAPSGLPGAGEAMLATAEAAWRARRATSGTPSGRIFHAMAYDSARGRVVLFGGDDGRLLDDTWEWDGSTWLERTPSGAGPSPRIRPAMAYDAARGRIVLFGGDDWSTAFQDTWEWDGATWVDRTPAGVGPSRRSGHAMACDAARGRVVLFGGYGVRDLQDTWEWDGSTWIDRTPSGARPSPRSKAAMAYDSARGRVVLFGGEGADVVQDTWEWDGAAWTERTPAGPKPSPRAEHAMAYDAARGRVVLFGGFVGGDPVQVFGDTWEWDGSAWRERTAAGAGPGAGSSHAMAYDAARERIVLFGEWGEQGFLDHTWEWDGGAWEDRTPSSAAPPGRVSHAMAYDAARRRVVLFGGEQDFGDPHLGDTWEWDGNAWRDRSASSAGPAARSRHAMAYDSARGRVVLFGGYDGENYLQDTWEWDGGGWVDVTPAGSQPPRRRRHAMVYDSARGRVVLFGGNSGGTDGALGDTWEWSGHGWTDRTQATGPVRRYNHAMAYDPARRRVVLFGGHDGESARRDTWEWDGDAWKDAAPTGVVPSARNGHAMAYDQARARVVLFGGDAGDLVRDTWEWDGAAWTDRTPAGPAPATREFHALTPAGARGRLVLFGGAGEATHEQGTWEWDHPPSLQPAFQFTASTSGAGIAPAAWSRLRVRADCGGRFSPYGDRDTGAALLGWAGGGAGLFGGAWAPLASNGVGVAPAAPWLPSPPAALLSWTSATAEEARRFLQERDGLLALQCRPSGASGSGAAQVAMRYVEVRLRYRTR